MSRDEAAERLGISRALAAFHLDRMAREGLLATEYRRTSGRSGPGAGRPAKLYRRAERQLDVSLPPRQYELAARLLARALDGPESQSRHQLLDDAAHDLGRRIGGEARLAAEERRGPRAGGAEARNGAAPSTGSVGEEPDMGPLMDEAVKALERYGFEPYREDRGIRLRNCPFDALAREHRDLVCGMNLSLIQGFLQGLGAAGITAHLEAGRDTCCVAICSERPLPA